MSAALIALLFVFQIATLAALLFVLRRKPAASPEAASDSTEKLALANLLRADLPAQFTRLEGRSDSLAQHLRGELSQLRHDAATEAARSREAADTASVQLRAEVLGNLSQLGEALRSGLADFRTDNTAAAEHLRHAVGQQHEALGQRLTGFTADTLRHHGESRTELHSRLTELGKAQTEHQDRLRATVEERLQRLNDNNAAKLDEMRQTVDEKLHATLQTRLTESFGAVTDQLAKVHSGLGEMTKLSAGVDDLSRIFTNVKSRGGFAEVQLGMLLSQMLAPSQFQQNVKIKPNTGELVEYAVRFPTPQGETLLPIDAKFPREAWERLETAYGHGSATDIASAGKAFEAAIRVEGKRICEKYIAPPTTTSFAIMFLPTEGLYAEVMRRDGLQSDIQQNCRVTIAGPSTLSAILNSFQMGFHMLQLQQKGDEVWKVLAGAKSEFEKFEGLMGSMEKQVGTVQNTIEKLNTRTRVITKALRDVSLESAPGLPANGSTGFDGLLPMLMANDGE